MNTKCPYCQTSYSVEHGMLGQEVECGVCHKNFIVESSHRWVDFFKNAISLKGRARRKEYWIYQALYFCVFLVILVLLIIGAVCGLAMSEVLETDSNFKEEYEWLAVLSMVIGSLFVPIEVRRLHDCNWSGWWCLIGNIPPWIFPSFVGSIIYLIYWIVLGCVEGTRGDNLYGADPKGVK